MLATKSFVSGFFFFDVKYEEEIEKNKYIDVDGFILLRNYILSNLAPPLPSPTEPCVLIIFSDLER